MRIDRIELITPEDTVELRFHPRMTVVTGLGRLEREALSSEILGALGSGRPGLSVDLVTDTGQPLVVNRPLVGAPSVRDPRTAADVTDHFRNGSAVDILTKMGFPRNSGRRHLRVGPEDLTAVSGLDATVARLAALDQQVVWAAAITLAEVEVEMASLAEQERGEDDPAERLKEEIERLHAERDVAADRLEDARYQAFALSMTMALVAMIVAVFMHPFAATPFLLAAGFLAGRSYLRWREYQQATLAEEEILEQAGLGSYLNFQMKKVDELTTDTDVRTRSLELAELHRFAKESWELVVGEGVTLDWAASHRDEITKAANELAAAENRTTTDREKAEQLANRFVGARSIAGQTVPIILDEVFADLDDNELDEVMPMLQNVAPHIQLVAMSNDPRVISWAQQAESTVDAAVIKLGDVVHTPSVDLAGSPHRAGAARATTRANRHRARRRSVAVR